MAACAAAVAEEAADIQTELIAEVRESMDTTRGREPQRFVPATLLSQGQVIFYTLRITNVGPAAAREVAVTQRVPANTTYVGDSASGPAAAITFSVDGGQTFASEASAARGAQPGQSSQYTHIRWQLRYPLASGAVALARFQTVFQ